MAIANQSKKVVGARRNVALSGDTVEAGGFKIAKCTYTFGVDAATGTVLLTPDFIPIGAIIIGGYLDVTTALTGSGNAALQVQAANDIVSATAISGAPWSTISKTAISPAWTFSTWIVVATSAKQPAAVFTGTLTAGVFNLYLFWIQP